MAETQAQEFIRIVSSQLVEGMYASVLAGVVLLVALTFAMFGTPQIRPSARALKAA